jgi:magnesium chelatase subunit D
MTPVERALAAVQLFALDPAGFGGLILRGPSGPGRDRILSALRDALPKTAPFRRAPIGIDDDRLLGGLDVADTLRTGAPVLRPGLLADVDGGVLVLASAERLAASAAGRIAAALDDGGVRLERDGRSMFYPARFGFVALDEGEGDDHLATILNDRASFVVEAPITAPPAPQKRRAKVKRADLTPAQITALVEAAAALGVVSMRCTMQAARAASFCAGLNGRNEASEADLAWAAALVLAPRATQAPAAPEDQPPPPPDDSNLDDQDRSDQCPPDPQVLADTVVAAARAAIPEQLLAALSQGAVRKGASGQGASRGSVLRGRPVAPRAGLPRNGARLSILATLRAAAPWQRLRGARHKGLKIMASDLRIKRFAERSETSVIFIVDASGSAAFQRLAEVKGAIELILSKAYSTRTHVSLVVFRQVHAEILAPPTRSLARARARLAALPGGGATPLASGLDAGLVLALAERAKGRSVLALVMSDGRANVARDGARDRTRALSDARAAAQRFRCAGVASVFIDTGRWPSAETETLAREMGARYAPLPFANADAVSALAQA